MARKGRKGSIFEDYAFLISAGFTFPVYAYIGYLIGNHLDKRFGTHPILTFFSILGAFTASSRLSPDWKGGGKSEGSFPKANGSCHYNIHFFVCLPLPLLEKGVSSRYYPRWCNSSYQPWLQLPPCN